MVSKSRDARRIAKAAAATAGPQKVTKPVKGDKNGSERVVTRPRDPIAFYPGEDLRVPLPSRRGAHKPAKARASLTPGTVVIMLAGAHRGKRAVLLKTLPEDNGLAVVCGPYKVNGVPLRKVSPKFLIATGTKVDVSGVEVGKFDKAYFKKNVLKAEKAKKGKKSEADFMETEEAKAPAAAKVTEEFKADVKALDAALVVIVNKEPLLKAYLAAKFSLTKGQAPHEMKF